MKDWKEENQHINLQNNDHPLYINDTVQETADILEMSKNRDAVYRSERWIDVDKLPYSLNEIPTKILTDFWTAEVKNWNWNVLDEACWDGHMTAWMQNNIESNQKYFLHDVSMEALKYAQKLFWFDDEQLILNPDLLKDNKKFDKILIWWLYHHLSPSLRQSYSKMYWEKLNDDWIICIASRTLDDPIRKKAREENPQRRKEIFSHLPTWPVDFDKITKPYFNIEWEWFMDIKEWTTWNNRKLKVIIARKNLELK